MIAFSAFLFCIAAFFRPLLIAENTAHGRVHVQCTRPNCLRCLTLRRITFSASLSWWQLRCENSLNMRLMAVSSGKRSHLKRVVMTLSALKMTNWLMCQAPASTPNISIITTSATWYCALSPRLIPILRLSTSATPSFWAKWPRCTRPALPVRFFRSNQVWYFRIILVPPSLLFFDAFIQ